MKATPRADQSGEDRVDIVDLEPQRCAVRCSAGADFLQEDGKALAVLKRHGAPIGDLEFDLEPEG
ncbi:MAG: hypothetical protein WCK95_29140 [Alphaproteobacteria bacterium]